MQRRHLHHLLAAAALGRALPASAADPLPLFDAHIHYSHDAWELVPPKQAVAILRQAGLRGALVSSSDDRGTQMLVAEAPDLIVPALRPYRSRSEIGSWMKDASVVGYLEERLAKYRYVGIGEFHLYGADADLPVPRRMVALAKERGLLLHAHSDVDCIERLLVQWPEARVLWAHSGFDRPEKVREVLRRHPRFSEQLDDRQINMVLRAAPLHDIGLLGLPDRLLDHPGPLDGAARQSMQTHTVLGADVLARVWPAAASASLPWAREIARSHHERWDGQGYPDGLAGDTITWPARLMAVVDAYDALTMRRPYRAALTHAHAVSVLAGERGRQFDPDVTDAFVDVCDAWPAIGQRHA